MQPGSHLSRYGKGCAGDNASYVSDVLSDHLPCTKNSTVRRVFVDMNATIPKKVSERLVPVFLNVPASEPHIITSSLGAMASPGLGPRDPYSDEIAFSGWGLALRHGSFQLPLQSVWEVIW